MEKEAHPRKTLEELGKWLMDISKYVLTAVLISYLFSDINDNPWQLFVGAFVVISTLFFGLAVINMSSTSKKRK